MNWTPLHVHDYYSLLDGVSKPTQNAETCSKYGYGSCAITNHGNLSSAVEHVKACKDAKIKPILGNELYICDDVPSKKDRDNRNKHHLCVLAKNAAGWKQLIGLTSETNKNFYYKPRIDLAGLANFTKGNLIGFSGHLGSELANVCLSDDKVKDDAIALATHKALQLQEIFGRGNFFIEIQAIDRENIPVVADLITILRNVSRNTGIPCIATGDSHYPNREDAILQRILLCSATKTKMKTAANLIKDGEEFGLAGFFKSDRYNIPSLLEISAANTQEELDNTMLVDSLCESYNILSNKPILPHFAIPAGHNQESYLREIVLEAWKKLPEDKKQSYGERVKRELEVIKKAGIAGYFLIVQDYVKAAKNRGEIVGPGRGSAAGSMVAYLSGITTIDPIEHELIFERFYNEGRNTADRIAMPDIDCDFEKDKRHLTIEYIKRKYGGDCVSHIVTFHRLQGRSALKEVFSAFDAASFDEVNRITDFIPDEAAISDDLQEMKEEEGDSSIIRWALENNSKELSEWCVLKDDGTLEGDYAQYFDYAIRLEGTKRAQSKHASGVIVSASPLRDICPMIHDKNSEELIAGMEMNSLEATGQVKFDILGVSSLDKLHLAINMIKEIA